MSKNVLPLPDGRKLKLNVPPAKTPTPPSAYAFGIYKAGSTLLNNIVEVSTRHAQHAYYSLNDDCFAQGVEIDSRSLELSPKAVATLQDIYAQPGYAFAGFRQYPRFDLPDLAARRKVLLVRDPRDAIVSHFFSVRYSHKAPAGTSMDAQRERSENAELVDYVLAPDIQEFFVAAYQSYAQLPNQNLVIIRYEDFIFDKLALIETILDHLEIRSPANHRKLLAKAVDIRPDSEKKSEHVRQVKPGNHIEKLPADAIGRLNQVFGAVLARYRYV